MYYIVNVFACTKSFQKVFNSTHKKSNSLVKKEILKNPQDVGSATNSVVPWV